MNTDPIADLLTRIRNAARMGHSMVEIPASKLKIAIVKLLLSEGYIRRYELKEDGPKSAIRILLKYDEHGLPVIRRIKRISRPGLRKYSASEQLPRILGGAGIAVVSTNKGLLTDRAARREKVGGEILFTVE